MEEVSNVRRYFFFAAPLHSPFYYLRYPPSAQSIESPFLLWFPLSFIMLLSASRLLALRSPPSAAVNAGAIRTRRFGGSIARPISQSTPSPAPSATALYASSTALLLAATCLHANKSDVDSSSSAQCSAAPLGVEPGMLSPSKEPATGILFPKLCNGMTFAGCGVRVKYGFVKVRRGIACRIYIYL